jgi:hypothetical protein
MSGVILARSFVILADSFLERNSTATTVISAVAPGAITLFVMWLWRRNDNATKTFDYRVIDDLPLFSSHERPKGLHVTYFGVAVTRCAGHDASLLGLARVSRSAV